MSAAPRSRRADLGALVFTVFLWVLGFIVLIGGFGFKYPANLAPILLGGTATALLTVVLAQELRRFVRGAAQPSAEPDIIDEPAEAEAAAERAIQAAVSPGVVGTILPDLNPEAEKNETVALLWTLATIALLLLFGFLVGVSVAMLGLLRVYARESWLMSILTTTVVMTTLYVAFGIFLRISFFPGVVTEMLARAIPGLG